ncbi:MAG: MarR family winged helix-turn-helix transcriptional regulator [Aristaeellaceae bacterium]
MEGNAEVINQVLVHLFNELLRLEENTLRQEGVKGLSIREVHILEAVCGAGEDSNHMSALAAQLRVTVGSLTVAVNTLVRKGYLERRRLESDRRRMHILPTEAAWAVENIHRGYHRRMTDAVMAAVTPAQQDVLIQGLTAINSYFYNRDMTGKGENADL